MLSLAAYTYYVSCVEYAAPRSFLLLSVEKCLQAPARPFLSRRRACFLFSFSCHSILVAQFLSRLISVLTLSEQFTVQRGRLPRIYFRRLKWRAANNYFRRLFQPVCKQLWIECPVVFLKWPIQRMYGLPNLAFARRCVYIRR